MRAYLNAQTFLDHCSLAFIVSVEIFQMGCARPVLLSLAHAASSFPSSNYYEQLGVNFFHIEGFTIADLEPQDGMRSSIRRSGRPYNPSRVVYPAVNWDDLQPPITGGWLDNDWRSTGTWVRDGPDEPTWVPNDDDWYDSPMPTTSTTQAPETMGAAAMESSGAEGAATTPVTVEFVTTEQVMLTSAAPHPARESPQGSSQISPK